MREATRRAIDALRPGQRIGLHPLFQDVTLEVILRAVLGLDDGPALDAARAQLVRMLRLVQSPSGLIWSLPALQKDLGALTPWAGIKREIEATDRILLAPHRRAPARAGGSPDDVLSMLVGAVDEEGQGLDDRTLRDQLMTLILAGHETTATTLSWAFEEILRVPGEQDRLIAEAEAVLGGAPVDADHLPRLERIDSAIKEALRLHPVTGAIGRMLKQPATIGGHELPAGVMVVAVMHLTHRRPGSLPGAGALRRRPLHRQEDRSLRLGPLRRRRPPLPGDGVRPPRDEGDAGDDVRDGPAARSWRGLAGRDHAARRRLRAQGRHARRRDGHRRGGARGGLSQKGRRAALSARPGHRGMPAAASRSRSPSRCPA